MTTEVVVVDNGDDDNSSEVVKEAIDAITDVVEETLETVADVVEEVTELVADVVESITEEETKEEERSLGESAFAATLQVISDRLFNVEQKRTEPVIEDTFSQTETT